jgi:nitrogenase-associated protein
MAIVHFWEKPGCAGNARQKDILRRAGHTLVLHDLLTHPWTAEELSLFLRELPVADWFNRSAPAVKSGEVKPEALSAGAAMALLLADPLLIRRPLLKSGGRREVGFILNVIADWVGVEPRDAAASSCGTLEGCGAAAGAPCASHRGG